jgi:hypothetical protein
MLKIVQKDCNPITGMKRFYKIMEVTTGSRFKDKMAATKIFKIN